MHKRILYFAVLILFAGSGGVIFASPETIVPGVTWYDTSENILSAHGAGVIKVGDTYYLIGMYMDNDPNNWMEVSGGHGCPLFVAITCYSSTDFVNWTFENNLLTEQPIGDLSHNRWVGRPKVIYNDLTEEYVMYMNIDDPCALLTQREGKVGVATCPTVNGNYTYLGSFNPLDDQVFDMTLFKDDDGKAYLITAGINIYELTSDYLGVSSLTTRIRDSEAEAPAMFKTGGVYYLLCSKSTWWTSNDNYYWYATSLTAKKWTEVPDFTPSSPDTCNSQTTYVQPIEGSSTTSFVYLGDRWDEWNFGNSTYIWLPLTLEGTTLTMDCYDEWTIDTETGEWAPAGGPPPSIFSDGFESGDFISGGWTISGNTASISESPYTGLYSANLCKVSWIEKAVSTVGYTDIHVEYVFKTVHMEEPDQGFSAEWYDGSNWNPLETLVTSVAWDTQDWLLPAGANNNPDFRIRFSNTGGRRVDCTYLDDVAVNGTEQ